jgi:tetratricopeptide (TPR) repeat protein
VEGSVRKAGTRLRVTAQLIRADDGLSVWANSYDRELTDIFAVQEEIATSVAGALRIPLGLKAGQRLVSNRPADAETYDLYLRGRAAFAMRSREELGLLEQVVARDPNFAPGWAKLSESRREMALYFQRGGEEARWASLIEGAETAAKKAIALDPNYAGGYSALSGVYRWRGRLAEAMDLAKQGLALDAEEPELLSNYAEALHTLGYLKDGLRVRDQLALLEPFNPLYNRRRGELMLANGNIDAGINQLEALHGAAVAALYLAPAYAHQGRLVEAANALLELPIPQGTDARSSLDAAAEALRSAANKSEPLVKLSDCDCEFDFVYAYANAPEHMLDWPENAMRKGDYRPLQILWWPLPPDLRKAERFKALVREAGMVEYWRAHGWPDLCRPVGANDFVCD